MRKIVFVIASFCLFLGFSFSVHAASMEPMELRYYKNTFMSRMDDWQYKRTYTFSFSSGSGILIPYNANGSGVCRAYSQSPGKFIITVQLYHPQAGFPVDGGPVFSFDLGYDSELGLYTSNMATSVFTWDSLYPGNDISAADWNSGRFEYSVYKILGNPEIFLPSTAEITAVDDTFFLTNFTADTAIAATWSGVPDQTKLENSFLEVCFGYGISDKPGIKPTIFPWDTRYSIQDNGFLIPWKDIVLPDSRVPIFLRCMFVTPIYSAKVDGVTTYYKGLTSKVWYTRDGLIDKIETSAWENGTETPTPEPEPDDTGKGILDKITDFFGSFFANIMAMIKNLFLPEDGYFAEYFDRMNTFFSEKLGMLYAPIDLFIGLLTSIMNAGTTDSGIPFPGLEWDGVAIIPAQVISLSAIAGDLPGLQGKIYFVTDVIMVGAVLWLAQQKLKEVLHT